MGVNLLPSYSKICNFDCVYCECGWNADNHSDMRFNSREEVTAALEQRLQQMSVEGQLPDVITFAGNGEPTLSPHFEQVIGDTITLRDKYAPEAKISVLSNATMLGRESVFRALKRVDNNILKLDSAFDATVQLMNNPSSKSYSVEQVVERMKEFNGELIVQTMFLRGEVNGTPIDNTTPTEVGAWVEVIKEIAPKCVMLYSIDRDTPCKTLKKVEREELLAIAEHLAQCGVEFSVA